MATVPEDSDKLVETRPTRPDSVTAISVLGENGLELEDSVDGTCLVNVRYYRCRNSFSSSDRNPRMRTATMVCSQTSAWLGSWLGPVAALSMMQLDQPAQVSLATVAVVLLLAPESSTTMSLVFHWYKLPGDDQRTLKMRNFFRKEITHSSICCTVH